MPPEIQKILEIYENSPEENIFFIRNDKGFNALVKDYTIIGEKPDTYPCILVANRECIDTETSIEVSILHVPDFLEACIKSIRSKRYKLTLTIDKILDVSIYMLYNPPSSFLANFSSDLAPLTGKPNDTRKPTTQVPGSTPS